MQLDKKSESDCAKHSEFVVIGNQAGAELQISLMLGLMEGSWILLSSAFSWYINEKTSVRKANNILMLL